MYHYIRHVYIRHPGSIFIVLSLLSTMLLLLTACSGASTPTSSTRNNGATTTATKQILKFPNVGTSDVATLDPATGPDANSAIAVGMIYTGLVKTDKDLNVVPDQATWQISSDNKVYTFTLNPAVTFSDGTPVTAHSYIYTWTRALLPQVDSEIAPTLEAPIVGASDVTSGKATILRGLKAIDDHTLQITLTQPSDYFLKALTNPLFFPLNQKVIEQYGQKKWIQYVANNGAGTGPFQLKEWDHNIKMVFTPNPHYYGNKTKLKEVDMIFVNDPATAYTTYRAGQYDFVWGLTPDDQVAAKGSAGFTRMPLLQTDLLFFDNTQPPFNNVKVRQAFAESIDKTSLVHVVFEDSVTPAPTILPPAIPGYQAGYAGLPFDRQQAKALLQSVYPDITRLPHITFSYPSSQVSAGEAGFLQQMWQNVLNVYVDMRPVELNAYLDEEQKDEIPFGFTQWTSDFPDPYDWLAVNLLSTASNNNGQWQNATFDQTVMQAEKLTGAARLTMYDKAEQIAITDVGWLPLDHQTLAAVIPPTVHGITLNSNGLYFGDWSNVYISQH